MLLDPESTAVKLIDQQTRKEKEKSRLLKKKKKKVAFNVALRPQRP